MRVSVFGLGYVGCVTAACLSRDGHEVIGVDLQPSRVACLNRGQSPVVEPGLEEVLQNAQRSGRLRATEDGYRAVLQTEASIVCVGTPSTHDGSLDLRAVRDVVRVIGRMICEKPERHVVMLRSTVPPGTCEDILSPALNHTAEASSLGQSNLVIVPEFLREGTAIDDYDHPPFVVVGTATGTPDMNEPIVSSLFGRAPQPIEWVKYREAEILKAVCNAFHALKVAFANEVGSLCAALGSNGESVMSLLVKDRKLNTSSAYLRPGLPFGGSCLPKDLRMTVRLGSQHALDLPLLRSILPSNDAHLKRAQALISEIPSRHVGLYGLTFKSGTDDLRESPMVTLAEHLIGKGYDLRIYDPGLVGPLSGGRNFFVLAQHLPHLHSRLTTTPEDLIEHAEVLLVSRDQAAIHQLVRRRQDQPIVIDLSSPRSSFQQRPPQTSSSLTPRDEPDTSLPPKGTTPIRGPSEYRLGRTLAGEACERERFLAGA